MKYKEYHAVIFSELEMGSIISYLQIAKNNCHWPDGVEKIIKVMKKRSKTKYFKTHLERALKQLNHVTKK